MASTFNDFQYNLGSFNINYSLQAIAHRRDNANVTFLNLIDKKTKEFTVIDPKFESVFKWLIDNEFYNGALYLFSNRETLSDTMPINNELKALLNHAMSKQLYPQALEIFKALPIQDITIQSIAYKMLKKLSFHKLNVGLGLVQYCVENRISLNCEQVSDLMYNRSIFQTNLFTKFNIKDFDSVEVLESILTCDIPLKECTWGIIIHNMFTQNRPSDAVAIFEIMKKYTKFVNHKTYSIMIYGFSQMNRVDKALKYLSMMKQENHTPNQITYNSLMYGFVRAKEINKIRDLINPSITPGFELDTVAATMLIYTSITTSENMDATEELFNSISKSNVTIDTTMVTTMFTGYFYHQDYDRAQAFFERMIEYGYNPNTNIVNLMIKLSSLGDNDHSPHQFLDILMQSNNSPNSHTYTSLITAFGNKGQISEVNELIDNIQKIGFSRSQNIFNLAIMYNCQQESINTSFELYQKMKLSHTPTAFTLSMLLQLCIHHKLTKEGMMLMQDISAYKINRTQALSQKIARFYSITK
jgi:pentatricopeptide repeat protein